MAHLLHENAAHDDEERLEAAKQRLSRMIGVWGATFNVMAAFAAPRVFAKLPVEHEMTPERITVLLDDYIQMITAEQAGGSGDELLHTLPPTRIVRSQLAEWRSSNPPPALLVHAARDFFTAFGWSEPDGGWDAWEGPPEL